MILDGLIEDVKTLSNTPIEMDYLKSGAFTKERIMQGFGVNAIIAGQIEGSNRASSDAADRHFVDYTVNPKIELVSQTLTGWLRYVYNDPSLTVWIEKCVSQDADTSLRWCPFGGGPVPNSCGVGGRVLFHGWGRQERREVVGGDDRQAGEGVF